MLKWIDVLPNAWYYRDVLELDRIRLNAQNPYDKVFNGISYSIFETGKPRITKTYIATNNQSEFDLPGYIPSADNPVFCYVDGIRALVESTANGKVKLASPVSQGVEVTFMTAGVPKMTRDLFPCSNRPADGGGETYPRADLAHKADYVFDVYYHLNESCVVFNRNLKRINVETYAGQDVDKVLYDTLGFHDDQFTIIDGTLYVPYQYNEIPVTVCYNYKDGANIKHVCERVIPKAPNGRVKYNDRFFPQTELLRYEFFVLLDRFRQNFYNRFTDRDYIPNYTNERNVSDIDEGEWYAPQLIDMLNEKFLDGCYVFPLYEDNTFRPEECITRAEAILYFNRFIEWTLEKFR